MLLDMWGFASQNCKHFLIKLCQTAYYAFSYRHSSRGLWRTICFSKCGPAKMTDYGQIGLNHPPWIKLSTFPFLPKISKSQQWTLDAWLSVSILALKLHLEASDSFWGRPAFFFPTRLFLSPTRAAPGGRHQLEAETKGSRSKKLMANTSHIQLAAPPPPICRAEEREARHWTTTPLQVWNVKWELKKEKRRGGCGAIDGYRFVHLYFRQPTLYRPSLIGITVTLESVNRLIRMIFADTAMNQSAVREHHLLSIALLYVLAWHHCVGYYLKKWVNSL